MQSILKSVGGRPTIEITLPCTGVPRNAVALAMLAAHGLREGQAQVIFLNPSTSEVEL
jgi:hypothetical protein